MTVDLLVVNYNTQPLLERLLDTLHADFAPDVWKLYITDNGSTDGSKQWLADHRDEYNIEYVLLGENVGYAVAINSMAAISTSEFLCAVNADTWFTTKHVREVEAAFHKYPRAGVMGVKQLDENNAIRHGGIFWDGEHNPIHRGWAQVDQHDRHFKDMVQMWTVSGSIYYARRQAWNECYNYHPYRAYCPHAQGPFLPTPHYFEETFCSQLMHHLGWEVWYNGEAETAGHTWHASGAVQDDNYFHKSQPIYVAACEALGIPHECK